MPIFLLFVINYTYINIKTENYNLDKEFIQCLSVICHFNDCNIFGKSLLGGKGDGSGLRGSISLRVAAW